MQAELNFLIILSGLRNNVLDKIMCLFTVIGDYGAVWLLLSLVLMLIPKTRKCGFGILLSVAIGFVFGNAILKPLIGRQRPLDILPQFATGLIPRPHGQSFPSGHTTSSFAAATAVFASNKKCGVLAYAVAALIAFSRMYLFVHFPTDILGGIILGVFSAVAAEKIMKLGKIKN